MNVRELRKILKIIKKYLKEFKVRALFLSLSLIISSSFATTEKTAKKPVPKKDEMVKVIMETSKGAVELELNKTRAPKTVANFLSYVDAKFYDNLIFHRVIKKFMVQGGGFTADMKQKTPKAPIKNEAANGLMNDVGTIAMARTNAPHSATSQFFINVNNNEFLNHQGDAKMGYAVFGYVTKGMSVLKNIELVKTTTKAGHRDVPVDPVVIKSIRRVK